MLKIAIACSTQGTIHSKTAFALMETIRLNKDLDFLPIFRHGGYIAENKAKEVEIAQNMLCSHIFFVDHDMVFDYKTLPTLLSRDKDIIGVNYNYRFLPLKPMTVLINDYAILDDTFEVSAVGGGMLLVKMSVFDKLKKPYFPMEQDEEGNRVVTEDFGFYEKAKEIGYSVYCDPTIKVGHEGNYVY